MDPHSPVPLEETSIARAPSKRRSSLSVTVSLHVSKTCTAVPEITVQESLSRRPKRKTKPINQRRREFQWATVQQLKTSNTYALRSGQATTWQRKHPKGDEDNQPGLIRKEATGETALPTQQKDIVKDGIKKQNNTHRLLQNDKFDPSGSDSQAAKSSDEVCEDVRKSQLDSGITGDAAPLTCVELSNDTVAKGDTKEIGKRKKVLSDQVVKRRQVDVQVVALTQPQGKILAEEIHIPSDMGYFKSTIHESLNKQAKGQNNKIIPDTLTTLNEPGIMEWSLCNKRMVKKNVSALSTRKGTRDGEDITIDLIAPNFVKTAKTISRRDSGSAKEGCTTVPVLASSVFPEITPDQDALGVSSNTRKNEGNVVHNDHLVENGESHVFMASTHLFESGYQQHVSVQKLDSPQNVTGITGVCPILEAKNSIPIPADTVEQIICETSTGDPWTQHGQDLLLTCSEWAEQADLPFQSKNDTRLNISQLENKAVLASMKEQTLTPKPLLPPTDQSSTEYLKSCNSATFTSVNSCGIIVLPDCGKWGLNATQVIQHMKSSRSGIIPLESRSVEAAVMEHLLTLDPCVPSTDCTNQSYQQGNSSSSTFTFSDENKEQSPLRGNFYNSEYYIEETAWRYFGDAAPESYRLDEGDDLRPLLPPDPLLQFPQTGHCTWTFDEQSRVVLGCFRNEGESVVVHEKDREFLFDMMERNDITVITEGHANGLNHDVWNLAFIKGRVGTDYHHKFRRFKRQLPATETPGQPPMYKEVDGYLTMKVADYIEYIFKRSSAMLIIASGVSIDDDLDFVYTDVDGEQMKLHLLHDVVYMIDYDIIRMLPELYEDLVSNLKIPECLPGGQKCMMNAVNQNGRPFMGPNLYMTPGGSFTAVHQDGFGTVDSGHLCLSGFNEVVMLRRLPENHKANAIRLLFGETKYDPLHELPHGDYLGEKPTWPTNFGIECCKKMNYCPSVFILRPGQQVHINKSRLHAFRKLTPDVVDTNDCHKELRLHVVKNETIETLHSLCISVAWDWMYLGNSCEGVNREVVSILECAAINRVFGKMSLAIPELCILALARKHMSQVLSKMPYSPSFLTSKRKSSSNRNDTDQKVLAGILPSLQFLVGQHVDTAYKARTENGVHIAKRPNSWENPQLFALDPYGNTDFFCKLCSCELSNIYMHCDGCENLLFKDFNICVTCHTEKKFVAKIAMHPYKPEKRHSSVNHVGDNTRSNEKRCPCKNGPQCTICHYCLGCSCRCHRSFTMHQRLLNSHDEHEVLGWVTSIVNDNILPYTEEVAPRLLAATRSAFNTLRAPSCQR